MAIEEILLTESKFDMKALLAFGTYLGLVRVAFQAELILLKTVHFLFTVEFPDTVFGGVQDESSGAFLAHLVVNLFTQLTVRNSVFAVVQN